MTRMLELQGVHVALLTPLREGEGRPDLDALASHVEGMIEAGVDGFVPLGTTGEFADLTPTDRDDVLRATVEVAAGRTPVTAGIGALGTAESCDYAHRASALGVDAVLALSPLFWRLDDAELFHHFRAVAEASDAPVVLYDNPAITGSRFSAGLVHRLAAEVPGIAGAKLTTADFAAIQELIDAARSARPDFGILIGSEDVALSGLAAGADGVVSAIANFCPQPLVDLVAAWTVGDATGALNAHEAVLRLFPIYGMSHPPILALKAAAHALGRPVAPTTRSLHAAPDEVVARVTTWARAIAADHAVA
jgi:dihydrodipicolinate synthase/N-acetylneuraminate lyase